MRTIAEPNSVRFEAPRVDFDHHIWLFKLR